MSPLPEDPMQASGTPDIARRCGAKTRHGTPCRTAAMPNGRCRMHGGKSTGPRTPEGLERLRAARTKHGGRSRATEEALRQMRTLRRTARQLLANS